MVLGSTTKVSQEIPRFDTIIPGSDLSELFVGFDVSLWRCTHDDGLLSHFNILCIQAPDIDQQQTKSLQDVKRFIQNDIGHQVVVDYEMDWREVDMVVACARTENDVDFPAGIYGEVFGIDGAQEVLDSTTDPYFPASMVYNTAIPPITPLSVGPNHAQYCKAMIHQFIRTVNQTRYVTGRFVGMMLEIEFVLRNHGFDDVGYDTAHKKAVGVRECFERNSHSNMDTELVISALDMLRYRRNALGHTPSENISKRSDKADDILYECIKRSKRPHLLPIIGDGVDSVWQDGKWSTRIASITSRWIDEYAGWPK